MKKETHVGRNLGLAGLAVAGIAGAYFLHGKNGTKNRKKVKSWALRAKADVIDKLEKAKDISKENFEAIVDAVATQYDKKAAVGEAMMFAKDLKRHWNDIKRELSPSVKPSTKKTSAKKSSAKKSASK